MGFLAGLEKRASIENPNIPLTDSDAWAMVFGDAFKSASGIDVTTEKALGVPAVWAAVNFLSRTIASLPLKLYRRVDERRDPLPNDPLWALLHDVVNEDSFTSFKWRQLMMTQVLTNGRAFTYVERNRAGRVKNLWPVDPATVTIEKRDTGNGVIRTFYIVTEDNRKSVYEASEIIDLPFILQADEITHYAPVKTLKDALGLAIALESYASRFFQNGGVPPLALHGPPASPGAVKRAKAEFTSAIKRANEEQKQVLYLPEGHELKPLAFNPEQGQLVEARLFQLQEVGRIYGMPPTFLQDLSHGTFSNTEQQDLHFVKHTLTHWLELWEQELNAKLFGMRNTGRFIEFDVDGLLRGDFKSRMDGAATAVQNALRTPNELRAKDNLPPVKGGNRLYVQGATVPLEKAGEKPEPAEQDGGGDEAGENDGE